MAEKTVFCEPCSCRGKRKVCSKCDQNLSHAAYIRHQNATVCPGKVDPRESVKVLEVCQHRLTMASFLNFSPNVKNTKKTLSLLLTIWIVAKGSQMSLKELHVVAAHICLFISFFSALLQSF